MSGSLSKSEVEKVLNLMFEDMKNAGLITPDMANNKDKILEGVTEGLLGNDNQLTWDEVKDPNVQKKLMGAIVETAINGPDKYGNFTANKDNNEFIHDLNKSDRDEKKALSPALEKKLQAMLLLKIALDTVFAQNDKQNTQTLVKQVMDPFKKELTNKPDGSSKKEAQKELSEFEKQLTESLSNMNGGDDPRITGEIQKIIQGPIAGNIVGWTNQSIADPNSKSALVMDVTYNAGNDPLGKENILKTSGLLTSALESVAETVTNTIGSYASAPQNKRE